MIASRQPDIHCHGGGGASFSEGAASARTAAYHHERGTTSVIASLVSAPLPELITQIQDLVALVHDGTLAGIHLEGPWLSARRRGAHHAEFLHVPDPAEVADLLAAGEGTLRMLTLPPERPGALQAIDMLVEKGVAVAIGHTDATVAQTRDALLHGAGVATHLFNDMRGLHHREGGPVRVLAASADVFAELIADGRHLAADVLLACMSVLGRRAVLVSDAVAAAGCADGRSRLGAQDVVMNAGEVRTEDEAHWPAAPCTSSRPSTSSPSWVSPSTTPCTPRRGRQRQQSASTTAVSSSPGKPLTCSSSASTCRCCVSCGTGLAVTARPHNPQHHGRTRKP